MQCTQGHEKSSPEPVRWIGGELLGRSCMGLKGGQQPLSILGLKQLSPKIESGMRATAHQRLWVPLVQDLPIGELL